MANDAMLTVSRTASFLIVAFPRGNCRRGMYLRRCEGDSKVFRLVVLFWKVVSVANCLLSAKARLQQCERYRQPVCAFWRGRRRRYGRLFCGIRTTRDLARPNGFVGAVCVGVSAVLHAVATAVHNSPAAA